MIDVCSMLRNQLRKFSLEKGWVLFSSGALEVFQVRNYGYKEGGGAPQCLDSVVGEDVHKDVTPYPCHGQGGNQVHRFGRFRAVDVVS